MRPRPPLLHHPSRSPPCQTTRLSTLPRPMAPFRSPRSGTRCSTSERTQRQAATVNTSTPTLVTTIPLRPLTPLNASPGWTLVTESPMRSRWLARGVRGRGYRWGTRRSLNGSEGGCSEEVPTARCGRG